MPCRPAETTLPSSASRRNRDAGCVEGAIPILVSATLPRIEELARAENYMAAFNLASESNHEGSGPRQANASGSISAFGAIDMAGNVRELRQSVDYLQTREDVDPSKIGFQGVSLGTVFAPIFMAMEPRIRAGLLLGGLLSFELHTTPMPPEIDAFNYAPRVEAPVLMPAGRYDAISPYESSQLPLYRLLGTP